MAASVNAVFEHVGVVSLMRRDDRWSAVQAELDAAGVRALRHPAVDGRHALVAAAWRAYAATPLATHPEGEPPISGPRDFWRGDHSPAARLAWFEARDGRKAIGSAGAWGLLASMIQLLERAVQAGWQSLLIFEDDVRLHRDFAALWPTVMAQLPKDWVVLQLGAMQLHWDEGWIDPVSPNLYACGGSSIGAHAVGLRAAAFGPLLESCRRRDMPFDVGPMNEIKRGFAGRCFTCLPNLAIQDGADSEIGTSRIFDREIRRADNVYRWKLTDYGLAQTDGAAKTTANPQPVNLEAASAPPLKPLGAASWPAPIVMVLTIGLDYDDFERVAALVARQAEAGLAIPVILTERLDFAPLRARQLLFEHVQTAPPSEGSGTELDWDLRLMRRLHLLRRKWRPARIMPFGAASAALLNRWRASPLEASLPGRDLFIAPGEQTA